MGNTEGIRPLGQCSCLMYIKVGALTGVRGRSSSDMFGKIILALSALAWASAQIPNLGFCPEYIPMANFNRQRVSNLNVSLNTIYECIIVHIRFILFFFILLFCFVCGTFNFM